MPQTLSVTIHEVSIQIPSSISLIVTCIFNDCQYETKNRKKIDPATKIANFSD